MKKTPLSVILYLLLVFASGIVVGGLGHRLYVVKSVSAKSGGRLTPEEYRRRSLDEMKTRLNLTPDQLQKINEIYDWTRDQSRDVREKSKPEYLRIQTEQTERIRAILTDQQRQEYEKMRSQREHRKGHGPGGGC